MSAVCARAQTNEFPPLPVVTIEPGTEFPSPFPQLTPPTPLTDIPNQVAPTPVAPSEEPSGYVPLPEPPVVPENPSNFVNVNADEVRTIFDENGKAQTTTAKGHVTVRHRNVLVTADSGIVDYETGIATFQGNVVFQIDCQQVLGKQITLNLRTGKWAMQTAITTINSDFAKGYLQAPVFADANQISGIKRSSMSVTGGEVTTCDLADPHYELVAKSVDIYPNVRLVLQHVSLMALDRRLITFRRLVIPLRQVMRDPELVPKIGQTAEEGFYAKFSYPISGSRREASLLLLDLMSKKGVGTGLHNNYHIGSAIGETQFYTIDDQNINQRTYTGRLNHNQNIGDVKFNFTSDFRANEYQYAPQSQTLTNRATFTRDTATSNGSLVIGYLSNNTSSKTASTTGNLSFSQKFGDSSVFQSLFNYIAYSGVNDTARLTSDLSFTKREDKFDWSLTALKQTDLSDEAFVGTGQFGGIEKLPEFSLVSDSARLGKTLPFGLPAQMRLTFGEFAELPGNTNLFRTYLELNTPAKPHPLSNTWTLLAGGGFRQYAYGDNTAQYAFDASTQLKKEFTKESNFTLTYRYQRPNGYTPFRYDYVGNYNIINAALNLKQEDKYKFSLLTGYNFEQKLSPWQDAILRWSVQPTKNLLLYTATGMNFNTWRWRPVINQLRIRSNDDSFRFDLGTRYDTTVGTRKLSQIRGLLDTKVGAKTRVQALAGYNGLTGSFDYQNFMITRDLHCWELSLIFVNQTGFYEEKGIRLNLRIKAFPLFQNFGAGTFGQVLDTSVGEVY